MGIMDFFKKDKKNKLKEVEFENAIDSVENVTDGEIEDSELISQEIENIEEIYKVETLEEEIESLKKEEYSEEEIDILEEEYSEEEIEVLEEVDLEELIEDRESFEEIEEDNKSTEQKKVGFFKKILSGLGKTRKSILSGIENVLKNFSSIDEDLFEELEEVLIMADIGVDTSLVIISAVRERVKKEKITEVADIKNLIVEEISKILENENSEFILKSPTVILVIGVNGVGKTTTIGKLTNNYTKQGKKVILAAADTFRAAAVEQLEVWGKRSSVTVIKHQENSDPGAVVFDAVSAAKARKADILICDTAGRLHNKKNLMDELGKIFRIINREYAEAQLEVLLVLDATTGQNALQQAKVFKEVANITGIVLTKLDGTAKGGIVIAIKNELKIPVRFVGVGEGIEDLQPFDAYQFAKALFNEE